MQNNNLHSSVIENRELLIKSLNKSILNLENKVIILHIQNNHCINNLARANNRIIKAKQSLNLHGLSFEDKTAAEKKVLHATTEVAQRQKDLDRAVSMIEDAFYNLDQLQQNLDVMTIPSLRRQTHADLLADVKNIKRTNSGKLRLRPKLS